jgi:hypothetical protein
VVESIEQKLSGMTAKQLVEIVLFALDTMSGAEQIDFIATHIDAQTSLVRLGADNPEAFLDEVENFCLDCLNEVYYSSEDDVEDYFSMDDYDSFYDSDEWDYDEYYSDTEWAKTFSKEFKLSMMYIRSGDISTGYEAAARLLSCLKEMMSSSSYLGTDEPMQYISVDWHEFFALHYNALFQYHTDIEQATERAFRYWMNFGDPCAEVFLSNVKDISVAERVILDGLKSEHNWISQYRCFELLEQLYARLGLDFDKISLAEALVGDNVYFYLYVVEGLYEQARWQLVVETAHTALERIPAPDSGTMGDWQKQIQQKIRAAIQIKLADSYEKLSDFEGAFETAKHMFQESPTYKLYKRARALAEKRAGVPAFLALVENQLNPLDSGFWREDMLCNIYSYEGEIQKLIHMASSQAIDQNYDNCKYAALSLIYRAVNGETDIGESLSEYLKSGSDRNGIGDMLNPGGDAARQANLLMSGVDLLREMIAFHIAAASRSRYAKAAYYMCVARDVYKYLKQEEEFERYFRDLMAQNSRRRALRDEMRIVYGKSI